VYIVLEPVAVLPVGCDTVAKWVSQPTGRTVTGYPYCIHSFAFRKLHFILRSKFHMKK